MHTTNLTTATIEVSEDEHQQILAGCRAAIFRDIWRLQDADTALSMWFALQRALPDDLDRSDTPKLNTLASWLREAPDIMRYLETSIQDPQITFAVLRFQEKHNRRAAEIRAEKAAAQPVGEAVAAAC